MSSLNFRPKIVNIKSTSSAVWWIKNPFTKATLRRQRKQSVGKTFCKDVADLFRNLSIHGYSKLFLPDFCIWEKLIWLVVHTITLFALITVLSLTWEQFVAQYFAISLHDPLYPVENVPFPAVSICSNNRISRRAALQYANDLKSKHPRDLPIEFFLERIKGFTNMYYKYGREAVIDSHDNFQTFLDTYDTWDNETFYNTKRAMRRLTPKCEEFLLKCSLAGVDIDCISKTAFQDSMTAFGPCCTFNWDDIYSQRKRKNSFVDPDMGLSVTLNTSQSDNFSPILNIYSSMVIIHAPGEFADVASGGSRVVFPAYGEESFIPLRARIVDTVEEMRAFSPKTRNCYFDNEVIKSDILLRSSYSFTNCITRCRISSMLALCRCLPFYMPLDLVDRLDGVIYCTLQHIPCLQRYTFKWNNVLTQRSRVQGLEREMEDALFCSECLPSCDDVQYHASLMSLPVDRFRSTINLENAANIGKDDISVVRVHFEDLHMQYFRRVVVNAWFEALSTVGNICGIFIGFSLVAIGEILFYTFKYFIMALKVFVQQQRNNPSKKKLKGAKLDTLDENELYICP